MSTIPRKRAMMIVRISTTTVEPIVCFRVGHTTFFSSTLTSLRNWSPLSIYPLNFPGSDLVFVSDFCLDEKGFILMVLAAFGSESVFFSTASVANGAGEFSWESCFFFFFTLGFFFLCKRAIIKFFSYIFWQARRDLNPQHPDLESDALPLELLACIIEEYPAARLPGMRSHLLVRLFVHPILLDPNEPYLSEFTS
jgi:hypothetical protein